MRVVLEAGRGSVSLLQRRLDVGYVILRTGVPNGLSDFQAEALRADGVGIVSPDRARAIIDALPPDRVAQVDRYGDAWLIELA